MAKIRTEMTDGWPVMTPLGRREAAVLAEHLDAGEAVLGQVIASFGQTVVATAQKVMIVKTGLTSGRAFGGRATTFEYGDIEQIEIRMGIAQGEFEILTHGAERTPTISRFDVNHLPNAVVFGKLDLAAFTAMAAKIGELSQKARP